MKYVDKVTHEPCPTAGNVLCTLGYTDPNHRHIAAHMVPDYDPTDAATLEARLAAESRDVEESLARIDAFSRANPGSSVTS